MEGRSKPKESREWRGCQIVGPDTGVQHGAWGKAPGTAGAGPSMLGVCRMAMTRPDRHLLRALPGAAVDHSGGGGNGRANRVICKRQLVGQSTGARWGHARAAPTRVGGGGQGIEGGEHVTVGVGGRGGRLDRVTVGSGVGVRNLHYSHEYNRPLREGRASTGCWPR